jgi:protein ImuA
MSNPDRHQRLAALRDVIADIERKPVLAETSDHRLETGDGSFPRLAGGLLQEVFTDALRNGGASLGFALGQARTLLTPKRVAILYLQLEKDGQTFGLPYGPGLKSFGFDPDQLILVRATDMRDLLWVAEESLACRAVAGIVADIGAHPEPLDFTASRRLSLRTAESGTSLFLLRYGTERQASASHLRWRLTPYRSGRRAFDEKAPGPPRWHLELEKGMATLRNMNWVLEWTENGFKPLTDWKDSTSRPVARPSVPGAVPALLGNGLSQTA